MLDRLSHEVQAVAGRGRRGRRPSPRPMRRNRNRPCIDSLEPRQLLAVVPGPIVPGQVYQEVAFYDSNGDTVEVRIDGPTSGGRGFTLQLAGGSTNISDIRALNLVGLTAENGLSIVVTPNELTIAPGGDFGKMFSSGYTNVARITADPGVTALGDVHLSGAIVNAIALPGVDLGGITLDTGMTAYVDTVNNATMGSINVSAPAITITNPITGAAEIYDESPTGPTANYNPTSGLIDLWDVTAASIGSIVVNGTISADTKNPYDESRLTNDLRGVIAVSGEIGSIVAPRGAMSNAIRAGGVGMIRLGQIDGEITTTDASRPMTIYVPSQFSGFLNAAGHLNLGFTGTNAEKVTANIRAGGGISGSDPSTTDPVLVPDKFAAPVYNMSAAVGIAGVEVNGDAMARWYSASDIGSVKARTFAAGSLFEAAGSIGDVEQLMTTRASTSATTGQTTQAAADLDGFFKAGGDIGDVKSPTGIKAQIIAGGSIGDLTGVSGGLSSTVVLAGGCIGDLAFFQVAASTTEIKAGGDIGDIHLYSGDLSWNIRAGGSIGDVTLDAGSINKAVIVGRGGLGDVTVVSPTLAAIQGGGLISGADMGLVSARAFGQTAILGTLIQAAGRIEGVVGISYGSTTLPEVSAGVTSSVASTFNGIDKAQIVAGSIGPVLGQAYVGTGLYRVVVHAQAGDIDSITGIGNGDGVYKSIVVAEGGIGPIRGVSTVLGSGIEGGSFDANGKSAAANGKIGQVTAQGGPAGGDGIHLTRFQASNRIAGIDATANANGGDAINGVSTYAVSYGTIRALVLGGQTGYGIVNMTLRAWSDYENNRPDVQVDAIRADVRSALGAGISGSTFQIKGDLTDLEARALNGSAIFNSTFSISQGDFGRIYAESINSGTAIDRSTFTASNGSIASARTYAGASTSGITAIAGGTSIYSNAIYGSIFSADANIGMIYAVTRGGTAILDSTFIADADYGRAMNGPNLPGVTPDPSDEGALFGIYAKTSGQNLISSRGISGSTFEGEKIAFITVEVTDREEGGAGISASTFRARNAVYDGSGSFDDGGTIGAITVVEGSLRGNGIEYSRFLAGAAGSIGDIQVRVLGGVGIKGSEFRTTLFDYDQKRFTGKIGKIRIVAGRSGDPGLFPLPAPPNDAWTLLPAGIDSSYFAAYAGIGDVYVSSLGTGVSSSVFLADFDAISQMAGIPAAILPLMAQDTPGDLGNVTIIANGRFGAGAIQSIFTGRNVGDVVIRSASREAQPAPQKRPTGNQALDAVIDAVAAMLGFNLPTDIGPAASAVSIYLATNGDIGLISVLNLGVGYDSIDSAYVALPNGYYGPVSRMDSARGNFFWGKARTTADSWAATPTASANSVAPATAGTYRPGDSMDLLVDFSRPVTVSGTPTFEVQVGSTTRTARYVGGGGTSRLVFRVDVQAGDSGDVAIPAGSGIRTDLKNHIIESDTGLAVTSLTPSPTGLSSVYVGDPPAPPAPPAPPTPVDTTAPTIVGVSGVESSATRYAVGGVLMVRVTFSEPVSAFGMPSIPMTIGNLSRSFVYSGGSGTNTLVFAYTLTRADVRARRAATISGQVVLPAGSAIVDAAGNAALLPAAQAEPSQPVTTTGARKRTVPVRTGVATPRGGMALRARSAIARRW